LIKVDVSLKHYITYQSKKRPEKSMGRNSTGALTTGEASRIELSYLLKKGYIQKGKHITAPLHWNNGSSIHIESKYSEEEKYLRVNYTLTDSRDGRKYELDYKITLYTMPSNLGKGEVLYFVCPQSSNLCRILYRAYGSHLWKCRQAYTYRIYYPIQTSSKINQFNDKYWKAERALEKMYKERATTTYKGKITRRAQRIERMEETRYQMDVLRWSPAAFPKSLQKEFERYL
jgi:hypothetical protein